MIDKPDRVSNELRFALSGLFRILPLVADPD
jgi:hypothetical protein